MMSLRAGAARTCARRAPRVPPFFVRARLGKSIQCVTMPDVKEISIRELHRRTGQWVRSARRYGAIVVSDRNVPVAKLTPVSPEPAVNRFKDWKPLKRFAEALDRPVSGRLLKD